MTNVIHVREQSHVEDPLRCAKLMLSNFFHTGRGIMVSEGNGVVTTENHALERRHCFSDVFELKPRDSPASVAGPYCRWRVSM